MKRHACMQQHRNAAPEGRVNRTLMTLALSARHWCGPFARSTRRWPTPWRPPSRHCRVLVAAPWLRRRRTPFSWAPSAACLQTRSCSTRSALSSLTSGGRRCVATGAETHSPAAAGAAAKPRPRPDDADFTHTNRLPQASTTGSKTHSCSCPSAGRPWRAASAWTCVPWPRRGGAELFVASPASHPRTPAVSR